MIPSICTLAGTNIKTSKYIKMKQTEQSIYDFKKGDIVTRLRPTIEADGFKDYSLVGSEVTFLGIANACIYLSKKSDIFAQMLFGIAVSQVKLPLDIGENGWSTYVKPDFLEEEPTDFSNTESIEVEIKKAIDKEDYMRAEYLKQKLEDIKKNNGGKQN
jgi:hypothetical protein